MQKKTKLVVATGNAHKLREIAEIFTEFEVVSQKTMGFDEDVEETGTTFAENALIKARSASKVLGCIALADDSGLCVDAASISVTSSLFADSKPAIIAASLPKFLEKEMYDTFSSLLFKRLSISRVGRTVIHKNVLKNDLPVKILLFDALHLLIEYINYSLFIIAGNDNGYLFVWEKNRIVYNFLFSNVFG